MADKRSDKEIEKIAKTPDQVLQTLTSGFQWSRKHSQLVVGALVLFFVVGSGIAIKEQITLKAETDLQEKYYTLERGILDKKKSFETAQQEAKSADKKGGPADAKNKKAATEKTTEKTPPAPLNFEKDFAQVVIQLKKIATEHPQSKAGMMAALQASEVLNEYQKPQEALDLLMLIPQNKNNDLLGALILKQRGNLQADLGQCQQAIETWDSVLNSKAYAFMHTDVKLRQAVCFESLKQDLKAENIYKELTQKTPTGTDEQKESFTFQEAQKYLRLLRMKKGT